MPTHQQILHFRTFGFTVFRGLLDPAEVAALAAEVTDELSDAFGGVGTDTDPKPAAASGATTCPWRSIVPR